MSKFKVGDKVRLVEGGCFVKRAPYRNISCEVVITAVPKGDE